MSSRGEMAENGGGGEIILFGVRVKVDPMRKSVSMNNLSQYQLPNDVAAAKVVAAAAGGDEDTAVGYASADDAAVLHHSSAVRERKRGVPWTEEEHKLFLLGLQKVGKGDWRGISRNFVKTRTPTQVASHAQKYFLRKNNLNRRRRRSSLFDITTDSVSATPMEESKSQQDNSSHSAIPPTSLPIPEVTSVSSFPVAPFPVTVTPVLLPIKVDTTPMDTSTLTKLDQVNNAPTMLLQPVTFVPIQSSSRVLDLDLNQRFPAEPSHLSLNLSLSSEQTQLYIGHAAFQKTSSFINGENIIRVS